VPQRCILLSKYAVKCYDLFYFDLAEIALKEANESIDEFVDDKIIGKCIAKLELAKAFIKCEKEARAKTIIAEVEEVYDKYKNKISMRYVLILLIEVITDSGDIDYAIDVIKKEKQETQENLLSILVKVLARKNELAKALNILKLIKNIDAKKISFSEILINLPEESINSRLLKRMTKEYEKYSKK